MAFFGKKKRVEQKNFDFQIKEVAAFDQGMGVLVAGQITEGVIHQGDRAVCLPGAGESFLCAIENIGYVDHRTKERFYLKEARVEGPSPGGYYIMMIPGRHKSDFRAGDRLVPMGSVSVDEPTGMTPRPCKGFLFCIRDIDVRDAGTVLVGTVLNGSAGIGDEVSFGHVPGEAVFTCSIRSIDGKDSMDADISPVERATEDLCRYGCSLIVDEPESRRFRVGEFLFIL